MHFFLANVSYIVKIFYPVFNILLYFDMMLRLKNILSFESKYKNIKIYTEYYEQKP